MGSVFGFWEVFCSYGPPYRGSVLRNILISNDKNFSSTSYTKPEKENPFNGHFYKVDFQRDLYNYHKF